MPKLKFVFNEICKLKKLKIKRIAHVWTTGAGRQGLKKSYPSTHILPKMFVLGKFSQRMYKLDQKYIIKGFFF